MSKSFSRKSRQSKAVVQQHAARRYAAGTPRHARQHGARAGQRGDRFGGLRLAAYTRPSVLGAAMLFLLAISFLWSMAATNSKTQPPKGGTTAKPSTTKPATTKPAASKGGSSLKLSDLPAMVAAYGERRKQAALQSKKAKFGTKAFSLTEVDITPGTVSDDRMPSVRPVGDLVAFASTRTDTSDTTNTTGLNADGPGGTPRYHIWLMDRTGTNPRQLTGLTTDVVDGNGAVVTRGDKNRDQFFPSWSPDGNQIVYVDKGFYQGTKGGVDDPTAAIKTELYVMANPLTSTATERRTFSGRPDGDKVRPTWNSSGQAIAFSTNVKPIKDPTYTGTLSYGGYAVLGSYDIFTINPRGDEATVQQVTGAATNAFDPTDSSDEFNPAYAIVNPAIIYFSSNRNQAGVLAAGRRIWKIAADGTLPRQITNPTSRAGGATTDIDDYPAPSRVNGAAGFTERVGFQSNSKIDTTDDVQDFNVWSLQIDTTQFIIASTPTPGPTATATAPPECGVTGFSNNTLIEYDPILGTTNRTIVDATTPTKLNKPESLVYDANFIYVCNRVNGTVDRYNARTGAAAPAAGQAAATFGTGVAAATGITIGTISTTTAGPPPVTTRTPFIFAASSTNNVVFRIDLTAGGAAVAFTNGEPTGEKPTGGIEAIAFGPDADSDNFPDLYVTDIVGNRIQVYNGQNGSFIREFISVANNNGLVLPTGLAFFPRLPVPLTTNPKPTTLYVSSAGTDQVIAYTITYSLVDGHAISAGGAGNSSIFINDNNGANFGVNAPERIAFGPVDTTSNDATTPLYVTPFNSPGGDDVNNNQGQGDRVLRFHGPGAGANAGLPFPSAVGLATGAQAGVSNNATFTQIPSGLLGSASLAFSPSTFTFNVASTPTPQPTAIPTFPFEIISGASVESNTTSSPNGLANSQLNGVGEDKSADREPSFGRSVASGDTTAALFFASQRVTAAIPGLLPTVTPVGATPTPGGAPTSTPPPNAPLVVNPSGGDQAAGDTQGDIEQPYNTVTGQYLPNAQSPASTSAVTGAGPYLTHDIWTTQSDDFTPPALVPQTVGNLQYPVLAPGPQSPFTAPRTAETGLKASSTVTVALVLKEQESGLASARLTFTNADQPTFTTSVSKVNDALSVTEALEGKPSTALDANNNALAGLAMTVFDDGPVSQGGHERQAGAVKGDGIYYCQATVATPLNQGDFYIDLTVSDFAGNAFLYDDIWGFSTQAFTKANTTSDLFVSDYTVGQDFPALLTSDTSGRFDYLSPVESYYLTNPKAAAPAGTSLGGDVVATPTPPTPTNNIETAPAGTNIIALYTSQKATFTNVDVWRVLCRGSVPQSVYDAYTPSLTQQLDPASFTGGLDPNNANQSQKTRILAVAPSSILWATPYTGDVFAGPGTLLDANTQRLLTAFLSNGGRLMVTGYDVAYGLSNNGAQTNTFLRDELQASFAGEVRPVTATPDAGQFSISASLAAQYGITATEFDTLQFPNNPGWTGEGGGDPNNSYRDSSLPYLRRANFHRDMDALGEGSNAATTTPSYHANGALVAQRIIQTRSSSIESRVAFFAFGLDGINRRYQNHVQFLPVAIDSRFRMAGTIKTYLKTGNLSGTVFNGQTNLPIPNFYVFVTGNGKTYIAKTDVNGTYELDGLPPGNYVVSSATYQASGQTLPLTPGYIITTSQFAFGASNGATTVGANLLVNPSPPGTLSGIVTSSNGTPATRADDTPVPNVPVLVKSINTSSIFPNGGKFARIVLTDTGGRFSVDNVPANTPLIVILNPTDRLESDTGQADSLAAGSEPAGDIPDNSGISYGRLGTPTTGFTPRKDLRRRLLPDANRPDNTTTGGIIVPVGNIFFLNDGSNDTAADDSTAGTVDRALLLPVNPSISGLVRLNGKILSGATVTLTKAGVLARPAQITASDGAYSFVDISPGVYVVTATAPAPYGAVSGTATNSPFTIVDAFTPDVVSPGGDVNLFKQDITGVVTVNGIPAAGFTVTLSQNGVPLSAYPSVVTDSTGSFTFINVPVGTGYTLTATRAPLSKTTSTFTITKGVDTAITIPFLTGSISGTVFLNGSPQAGAQVQLLQNGGVLANTTTAADGSYTFATVTASPPNYTVRATFGGDAGTYLNSTNNITVTAGSNLTGIDVNLFLETIKGIVTLNGVPIGNVTVQLINNNSPNTLVATTTTLGDGSYSFPALPAGSYTLVAAFGGDTISQRVTVNRATSALPAQLIVKAPDLALLLETISGRVTLNGSAFGGATVNLINNGVVVATTTSAATGAYSFVNKPAGTYTLQATASAQTLGATGAGSGDTVTSAPFTVVRGVNFPAPDLKLLLETVSGKVLLNGKPATGATVQLIQGSVLKTVVTGNDGTYSFSSLLPGSYQIKATKSGDSASVSVVVQRGVNVTASDIQLFLETITGKVLLNGLPIRGATVLLIKNRITVARAATDSAGAYSFGNLLPGSYAVQVLYGGDTQTIIVRVTRGVNVTAPVIQLKLETVTGRVTLNGSPISGAKVVLTQGAKTIGQKTSASDGTFSFSNLPSGAYTLTASRSGATAQINITVVRGVNLRVPDLQLKLQSITGLVYLNGKPALNAVVLLLTSDGTPVTRTVTNALGSYSFATLPAGSYTVRAVVKTVTKDVTINITAGRNVTVPTINITIAGPTPTPAVTPTPSATNDYEVGQTYQISIPYMDSADPNATTTPAKAFTVPPSSNGTQNFSLFRYNAQTEKYEQLNNNSTLRRGEGYFLRPETSGTSLRKPATDATRKPTTVTSFSIVLHTNPSVPVSESHNGFNLIGSPFNPAVYSGADFLNSQVILPSGKVYKTVADATAAGIISSSLFTLDQSTGNYVEVNGTLTNFTGYYVRTFVDGARLVLRPSAG